MAFLVPIDHVCFVGHVRSSNASGGSPTTPSSIRAVSLRSRALRGVHNFPRTPVAFRDISPRWHTFYFFRDNNGARRNTISTRFSRF